MKNNRSLILFAGLLVCSLALVLILIYGAGFFGIKPSSAESPAKSEKLSINQFRPIQGTSIFVATVEQAREMSLNLSARWFGFDDRYTVRNLVFLDGSTLASHFLFDTNDNYVVGIAQFPVPNSDPNSELTEVKWLVYKIIKQDTNSDGLVNGKDLSTIAISTVSGANYVELINSVNTIYGMDIVENSVLLCVYEANGENSVSKIDLEQQIVLETKPLAKIP